MIEPELPADLQNRRSEVAALIPPGVRRVLEIGCAAGEMGRALKEGRPGVEVVGVERDAAAGHLAREKLDAVICGDIEAMEFLPYPAGYFDCITCGEVLEHLRDPEKVLRRLLEYLHPEGSLVGALPNIRHQSVLLELLVDGRWQYRNEGLPDRLPLRFFTLAEIRALLGRLGLRMAQMSASQSPVLPRFEALCRAVAELGGDVQALRQEGRILQFIFRAVRQQAGTGPRASIVIPVFNQAEYTEQCLHGLAAAGRSFRGNWEGPFFAYSSLAHVNRELVLALLAGGRCELGLVPFGGAQFGVEEDPERFGPLAQRLERPLKEGVDFHLRHRWPPDFRRPVAGRLVLIQPWELGRIPQRWVPPLREQVDQIWAYTTYVRQCYLDSGIDPDQVEVVPLGVDTRRFRPGREPLNLPTDRGFKFLFVGGTLFRKGIDLLLEAYRTTFAPDEDVCLVIKDMGVQTFYRGQHAGERIRQLQADPACPPIVYLTEDLSGAEMARLYAACDCLVHPYRGEGFGLPVAEAMACGLPVVVTAGGACDDFCGSEIGYKIPALRRPVRFQEETVGPAWVLEPDEEALKSYLRQVIEAPEEAAARGRRGVAWIAAHYTWEKAAARALEVLEGLCASPPRTAGRSRSQAAAAGRPGTAVVVLGGGDREAVRPLAAALGEEVVRYDLDLQAGPALGEQLEAIRQASGGEFLVIVSRGTRCSAAGWTRLFGLLRSQAELALAVPCRPGEAEGAGLEEMAVLAPDCVIARRAALEAIGGFEAAFRTPAVLDEAARACRRRGWRVVRVLDCQLDQGTEVVWDEKATARERQAVQALEEGDGCKAEGDLPGAEEGYRRAVQAKEDFVEPIVVLGSLLMEQGLPDRAVEVIARLVQLDSGSYQAHNLLGLAQYQAQDWEGARQSFERALVLQPENVETLVNLSVLEWGQENASRALDCLERAAALDPGNRDVIVNTGLIQIQTGNVEGALVLFRRYVQANPRDVEVLGLLVDILLQTEQLEEARQVARRILEIQPRHAKARAIVES